MIKLNVINDSTVVSDADAEPVVAALQRQVTEHLFPAWGVNAELVFTPKGKPTIPDAWPLVIADNSDTAGALGWHDLSQTGQPLGKIFAKTDLDNGTSWTVTASHECLELLIDPDINLVVFREDIGQLWSYEVGDAVEADELGYQIEGVLVSDFVFPSWFEGFRTTGPFDQQNKLTAPFQILPGGYIGFYSITDGNGWQQQVARSIIPGAHGSAFDALLKPRSYRMRPPVGSRRERRRTPRSEWIRSTK